ncbi:hypothetical protein GVAV_000796 [Gurleya vavrai]
MKIEKNFFYLQLPIYDNIRIHHHRIDIHQRRTGILVLALDGILDKRSDRIDYVVDFGSFDDFVVVVVERSETYNSDSYNHIDNILDNHRHNNIVVNKQVIT